VAEKEDKSKDEGYLTPEQLKELQDLCGDMLSEAEKVVEDFKLNPSEQLESGSVTYRIHQDSPYLEERWKGEQWKKVVSNTSAAEDLLANLNKKDVDNKENNS
tara:strand:+ start:3062 stop:3370 length:309 start_codon:yes stop_codon:yes gene_type:complete